MVFSRILVALDSSTIAAHALDIAVELATQMGSDLAAVHSIDYGFLAGSEAAPAREVITEVRETALCLLEKAGQRMAGTRHPWTFLREGRPAEEIIAAANEWGADLIVIGTHGRSSISQVFLGSTASHVIKSAACPVLTVKSARSSAR